MTNIHKYTNYLDEKEDRASNGLFYKFILVFVIFYLILFGVSCAFYAKYDYVTVVGRSMQPNLNPDVTIQKGSQDGVMIEYTKDINYNDIIILKTTGQLLIEDDESDQPTIIKRALAFGGDYITIAKIDVENSTLGREFRFMRVKKDTGIVEVVQEDYIKSYTEWTGNSDSTSRTFEGVSYERKFFDRYYTFFPSKTFYVEELKSEAIFFEIPEGEIFFMGDNRGGSTDARIIRPIKEENLVGKVVEVVRNGSSKTDAGWWIYRLNAFAKLCWRDILRFFGAKV